VLLWAAISYRSYGAFTPPPGLDIGKGIGAGAYVVVGIAGLIASGAFLHNLFDAGATKTLRSGGSIPLLNWAAALEVAAAMLLLFSEYLTEYAEPLAKRQGGK
jgi:multicomponent Na+:H+ antiporter subunit B